MHWNPETSRRRCVFCENIWRAVKNMLCNHSINGENREVCRWWPRRSHRREGKGRVVPGLNWSSCSTTEFTVARGVIGRSDEHTSELPSLMRISYAVSGLKKKKN